MAKKKTVRVKRKVGSGKRAAEASSHPPFEESLDHLERIVEELEGGSLSLSESLAKYEDGVRNLKVCHEILKTAENRIRILTGIDNEGVATSSSFDETQTEFDAGGTGQARATKRSVSRQERRATGDSDDHGDDQGDDQGDDHGDANDLFS